VTSSTASKISSTPFPPGRRGRLDRKVPQGLRVIPADLQDHKGRRAPTATMVRLDRLEMMALPVPMARREMKGQRVPQAHRGRPEMMVRLDLKARPEPMDSREDLLARKEMRDLKGRRERMAPKVRRGR
jgi:hypothetical protein